MESREAQRGREEWSRERGRRRREQKTITEQQQRRLVLIAAAFVDSSIDRRRCVCGGCDCGQRGRRKGTRQRRHATANQPARTRSIDWQPAEWSMIDDARCGLKGARGVAAVCAQQTSSNRDEVARQKCTRAFSCSSSPHASPPFVLQRQMLQRPPVSRQVT